MKAITTFFFSMLISVGLLAQGDLFDEQVFKVQNHGRDYPSEGYYTFGQTPTTDDQKFTTSNDIEIDNTASFNGVVVTVYEYDNIGWSSKQDAYAPYYSVNSFGDKGEYRFDWMTSATEVNQEVVQAFIDLMNELPERVVVSMYTGYYHGIDQMSDDFYQAVESVRSEEIRKLSAASTWAFVGSKCTYEPVKEVFSNDQDALIEVIFQPYTTCAATSISETTAKPYEVKVFPNPADQFLSVTTTDDADVQVSIYDLTGQIQMATTQTDRIDITELSRGIYIVQVQTVQKTYSSRITKK